MLSTPAAKAVEIDHQPARPVGRVTSCDAIDAALDAKGDPNGRFVVRPLSAEDRALAEMFAPGLERLTKPARQADLPQDLADAGYTLHFGDPGEDRWWWCWSKPDGSTDVEAGADFATAEEAIADAQHAFDSGYHLDDQTACMGGLLQVLTDREPTDEECAALDSGLEEWRAERDCGAADAREQRDAVLRQCDDFRAAGWL